VIRQVGQFSNAFKFVPQDGWLIEDKCV
jgi:hypothetical protein